MRTLGVASSLIPDGLLRSVAGVTVVRGVLKAEPLERTRDRGGRFGSVPGRTAGVVWKAELLRTCFWAGFTVFGVWKSFLVMWGVVGGKSWRTLNSLLVSFSGSSVLSTDVLVARGVAAPRCTDGGAIFRCEIVTLMVGMVAEGVREKK